MNLTRRDFLRTSLATGSLVSMGLTVPSFLGRTALAAPPAGKPGAKDTLLVVVQLIGGNDGLNTVIPFTDPEYAKLRPTLKQPRNQIKKVNDSLGLHPSMTGMASLLEDRSLCIVQGVGYPNPSQSHFRSMDIWQAGNTAEQLTEGWLGRAMRKAPAMSAFHLGHRFEKEAPFAFEGAPQRVPTLLSLEDFQLHAGGASLQEQAQRQKLMESVVHDPPGKGTGLLDFIRQTAVGSYSSAKRLQEIGKNYQPKVPYPNTALAQRLRLAAQLIDANLGARIFYVTLDGFDTHAAQANEHAELLEQLSGAISAFFRDLCARGHRDRLLVMTFSEFGRRARENGSRGTDHGSAAPMFLIGGKVQAGLVGSHPSLTDLDHGNLKHHTDFRQVYATILDRWLGINSREVLGQEFKHVPIFAKT